VCTVKEFDAASIGNISHLQDPDSSRAIGMAKSLFVNSLTESRNDIYIDLRQMQLNNQIFANAGKDMMSISMTSSSGTVFFANSANGSLSGGWQSSAFINNEVIGEQIRASNFDKNEFVQMTLSLNGRTIGESSFNVWQGNRVFSGKRIVSFTNGATQIANLQINVAFVGNGYNTDISVERVLHWKAVVENNGMDDLMATLSKFKVLDESEFLKVGSKLLQMRKY
jgi:hypothetical protein